MSFLISGTGSALPERIVTNDDLSSIVDTNDEWIVTRTGIKTRHICTTERVVDLCETAAKKAVENAGIKMSDIDLIICSTLNGEFITPSLGCAVAERLGISPAAFDINGACSGFVYALDLADMYLQRDGFNNILVIAGEVMSKHLNWTDRSTCILFGDGAGAAVVCRGDALKYMKIGAKCDFDILNIQSGMKKNPFSKEIPRGYVKMDGKEVYRFAVNAVKEELSGAKAATGIEKFDFYVLHQANLRIIDAVKNRVGADENFPVNIDKCGNMSSASIPVLLDEMVRDGRIQKGTRLFISAFGAGLTTATAVIIWE